MIIKGVAMLVRRVYGKSQLKDIGDEMIPGPLEIIIVAVTTVLACLVHLVAALVSHAKGRTYSRWLFAVYGIPACFVIASLATPPDLLSTIIVAFLCGVVCAIVVSVWFVLSRRQAT